jgi:two-component system chemotaxis response regulator CheB
MADAAGTRTRVLVVDDAVVMRRMLTDIIGSDPELEVVGSAPDGKVALARIDQLDPDVVTLDVEMPEMDGLETLVAIRRTRPRLPVIMFSTLTRRGAAATIEALATGASDYVTKPANVGSTTEGIEQIREQLVPRIKALAPRRASGAPAVAAPAPRPAPAGGGSVLSRLRAVDRIDAVLIGTSTGGPNALEAVLSAITEPLPVPVFIVQHMPPNFTALLAERLDRRSGLRVVEAEHGVRVEPGTAYVAPGGCHMEVAGPAGLATVRLTDDPPVHSCRPAVDVLFRSAARVYGAAQLGIVMTGMGRDGTQGCEAIGELGAEVYAQDEATSVVWGMPGFVVGAGLAHRVLPLEEIAPAIAERVARGRALTGGVLR